MMLFLFQFFIYSSYCFPYVEIGDCIGSGYKNSVFTLKNHDPKLILRASLVTDGNKVLNFRDPKELATYKTILLSASNRNTSLEKSVLEEMHKCPSGHKDIVPLKDLEKEYHLQARIRTFSHLFMGIAGSVARKLIKLDQPTPWNVNKTYLALDIQIGLAGNLQSLTMQTEENLYLLLYWYFSDQCNFKKHTGHFHADGHAGNILYHNFENEIYYAWADFGATSNSSDVDNQFQNSLRNFHNKIFEMSGSYYYVRRLLTELCNMSFSFHKTHVNNLGNLQKMADATASSILLRYGGNDDKIKFILKKMSPSLGFAFDYFIKENMARKQEVQNLRAENIMQDRKIFQQGEEIGKLRAENVQQGEEIGKLRSEVVNLQQELKQVLYLFKKYTSQINNIENVPIALNASVLIDKDEL